MAEIPAGSYHSTERGHDIKRRCIKTLAACCMALTALEACTMAPMTLATPVSAWGLLLNSKRALADEARLNNVVQRLIARCMQEKHFRFYPAIEYATRGEYQAKSLPEFPSYARSDLRRSGGYGLSDDYLPGKIKNDSDHGASREIRYASKLNRNAIPAYYLALEGGRSSRVPASYPDGLRGTVMKGGCQGRAESRVFGSALNYAEALTGLNIVQIDFVDDVEASNVFKAIIRSWSLCMRARGFSYASPTAASSQLAAQYSKQGARPTIRRKEIAVAAADARCASTVSLRSRTRSLQKKVASELARPHKSDLLRYTIIYNDALRRVKNL